MVRMLLLLISVAVVCSSAFAEVPDSLQLALTADAETYCLGQPVFVVVTLTNAGTKAIRAQLPHTWSSLDFDLEVAVGKDQFAPAEFRLGGHLRFPVPFRDFKSAEMLGASTALLLKGGGRAPRRRLAEKEDVDLSRWLLFGQPGTYRVRVAANIVLKDRAVRIHSKEITLTVTPAAKGYEHFVRFAVKHCRGESLALGKDGFAAARELAPKLEKTVYADYVDWMMLRHHMVERMTDDQKPKSLSDEEKAQRARFKKYAEGVVGFHPKTWTMRKEEALAWLVLYHVQENELAKAKSHADVLQKKLPWSRYADVAERLEEELKKAERAGSTTEMNPRAQTPTTSPATPSSK